MSRSQFTEEEKKMIRKFKVKNESPRPSSFYSLADQKHDRVPPADQTLRQILLLWMLLLCQGPTKPSCPRRKFCSHGRCWFCLQTTSGNSFVILNHATLQSFLKQETKCRKTLNLWKIQQCNECGKMDFGETCSATDPYNFIAKQDEVTGISWIQVNIHYFWQADYFIFSASMKKVRAHEHCASATRRLPTIFPTPSASGTSSTTPSGATSILKWTASELAVVEPTEASDSTSHLLLNAADSTQGNDTHL